MTGRGGRSADCVCVCVCCGGGDMVTDRLSISGCTSEALRLNQIFTHLPPTALSPIFFPSLCFSLPSSVFFPSLLLSLTLSQQQPWITHNPPILYWEP